MQKQKGPGVTLVNSMFIEEPKENKAVEQHFVEAHKTQMDVREKNVVEAEVHPSIEMQVEIQQTTNDAPPNFLKDSNASPKVKTVEEKGVEIRSLTCNTSGVKGACQSSGMGSRKSDKQVNYSHELAQT